MGEAGVTTTEVQQGKGTVGEARLNQSLEELVLPIHRGLGGPDLAILADDGPGEALAAVEVLLPSLPKAGAEVPVLINNSNFLAPSGGDWWIRCGGVESDLLRLASSKVELHPKTVGDLFEAAELQLGVDGGVAHEHDVVAVVKVGEPFRWSTDTVGDVLVELVSVDIILNLGAPIILELLEDQVHAEDKNVGGHGVALQYPGQRCDGSLGQLAVVTDEELVLLEHGHHDGDEGGWDGPPLKNLPHRTPIY